MPLDVFGRVGRTSGLRCPEWAAAEPFEPLVDVRGAADVLGEEDAMVFVLADGTYLDLRQNIE